MVPRLSVRRSDSGLKRLYCCGAGALGVELPRAGTGLGETVGVGAGVGGAMGVGTGVEVSAGAGRATGAATGLGVAGLGAGVETGAAAVAGAPLREP